MTVEINLQNTCLNCERPIPMDFEICTKKCLDELAECAKAHGVKSYYTIKEVWKP